MDKKVEVNGYEYDLSIVKTPKGYHATLTPVFITDVFNQGDFRDLYHLKRSLKDWIISRHKEWSSDKEHDFFNELKEWDGVIHV